jgi:sugar/nucleoside kinase (ribokinase family)
MIVVIGDLVAGRAGLGAAFSVAAASVRSGATVEVVGAVPEGSAGDAITLSLARAGIGHAALLRAQRTTLEPPDVELALRYLTDTGVIVLVEVDAAAMRPAIDAADWSGGRIVVVGGSGWDQASLPEDAIVLEAPGSDPDGTFAGFVAELAIRLDKGEDAARAWEGAVRETMVEAVPLRDR